MGARHEPTGAREETGRATMARAVRRHRPRALSPVPPAVSGESDVVKLAAAEGCFTRAQVSLGRWHESRLRDVLPVLSSSSDRKRGLVPALHGGSCKREPETIRFSTEKPEESHASRQDDHEEPGSVSRGGRSGVAPRQSRALSRARARGHVAPGRGRGCSSLAEGGDRRRGARDRAGREARGASARDRRVGAWDVAPHARPRAEG